MGTFYCELAFDANNSQHLLIRKGCVISLPAVSLAGEPDCSAEDISSAIDRKELWKRCEDDLPNWSRACKTTLPVQRLQPPSAAAEHAFSILCNSLTEKQTHANQSCQSSPHQQPLNVLFQFCVNLLLKSKLIHITLSPLLCCSIIWSSVMVTVCLM